MSRKQNSLMRFTRTERLAQLSEQEIVIEQKKREIQARIEARRKNQNEENLKKLEAHKETKNINKPGFPKNVHKRDGDVDNQYNGESGIEDKKDSLKNAFSNDGSFLDQFKKLSQSGLIPANYKAGASQSSTKEVKDKKEGSLAIESPSLILKSYIPVNSSVHLNQSTEEAPHKTHTIDTISMKFKNNTVKKLDPISNPLNDDDEDSESDDDSTKKNKFAIKEHIPLGKITTEKEDSLRISSAFTINKEKEKNSDENEANICYLAEMVARNGDEFEETLKKQHENDPSYRFLFDKKSKEYIFFHHLILKYKQNALKNKKPYDSSSDESDSNLNKRKSSMQKKERNIGLGQDSSGSDSSSKQRPCKNKKKRPGERNSSNNYQGDSEEETNYYKMPEGSSQKGFAPVSNYSSESSNLNKNVEKELTSETLEKSTSEDKRKRKRKSRWGDAVSSTSNIQPPTLVTNLNLQPLGKVPAPKTNLLSQLTRSDPGLIQYAKQTFGSTNLSEEDWKKAEDHYKINLLYQDLVKKRAEISKLERAGKFKYEYDSDEDVEGGTWEHKLRQQEMLATQLWAEELTRQAAGKHHIGDFLPPEELEKFMERYNAVKEGREPDLSDYKEFKLKEDNVGYKLLQKMGWNEGQGLGQDGSGITNPVNKATTRHENQGLGVERPDGLEPGDDEYDAYRKRMMLAYRFRPNPLNNPRRPYY